jgi:hypothetical protein
LGSIIAIITYWMNRGKAEAETAAKAEQALQSSNLAVARVTLLSEQLAESRIEFARDYASHRDLAASETRYAAALDGLRTELRGMNERLDRIIEGFMNK